MYLDLVYIFRDSPSLGLTYEYPFTVPNDQGSVADFDGYGHGMHTLALALFA
jgi:hypothetical protein